MLGDPPLSLGGILIYLVGRAAVRQIASVTVATQ